MQNDDKMICPYCKVEMNFHAMKIDYTQTTNNPTRLTTNSAAYWKSFIPALNVG